MRYIKFFFIQLLFCLRLLTLRTDNPLFFVDWSPNSLLNELNLIYTGYKR